MRSAPFYGSRLYLTHCEATAEYFDVRPWNIGVLARAIPGTAWRDAAGSYPLTCLDREADIDEGLCVLQRAGFISFVGVLDPTRDAEAVASAFPWRRAFKPHYLIRDPGSRFSPTARHRGNIRKARQTCLLRAGRLAPWLPEWSDLYGRMSRSRGWSPLHRFSARHEEDLAGAEEIVAFRADVGSELAAMCLFVRDGERAYYHLGASTPVGYAVRASYGVMAEAVEYFSDAAVVDLGGAAGMSNLAADGLARFKRGFANAEATAWLVGSILDEGKYRALSGGTNTDFFPAYRADGNQASGTRDVDLTGSRSTMTDASHNP
jgi:hypothetical protein